VIGEFDNWWIRGLENRKQETEYRKQETEYRKQLVREFGDS